MLAAAAPRYPASRIMMRFVRELGGTRESTLVGQGARTLRVDAALANGTLAYYCDIEPLHVGAILHALAVVVPASLAVGRAGGERRPALPRLGRARCRGGDPRLLRLRSGRALRPRLSSERGGGRLRRGGGGRLSLPAEPGACRRWRSASRCSRPRGSWPGPMTRPSTRGRSTRGSPRAMARRRPASPGSASAARPRRSRASTTPSPHSRGRRIRTRSPTAGASAFICPTTPTSSIPRAPSHTRGSTRCSAWSGTNDFTAAQVERIVLRFPKSGAHMIDDNPLKSHCAQYILPVGLVFGRVVIDDILFDRTRHPEVARLRRGMTLRCTTPGSTPAILRDHVDRRAVAFGRPHADPPGGALPGARGKIRSPPTRCATSMRGSPRPVVPRARSAAIRAAVEGIDRAPGVARLAGLLRQKVGGARTRD